MDETNKASPEWGKRIPGDLYERWPRAESGEPEAPTYLCHCRGLDMDEAMLVTRMESYGIPCLCRYPNNGEFGHLILGLSGTGVDVFVPASLWADACELLKEPEEEKEDEPHDLA